MVLLFTICRDLLSCVCLCTYERVEGDRELEREDSLVGVGAVPTTGFI